MCAVNMYILCWCLFKSFSVNKLPLLIIFNIINMLFYVILSCLVCIVYIEFIIIAMIIIIIVIFYDLSCIFVCYTLHILCIIIMILSCGFHLTITIQYYSGVQNAVILLSIGCTRCRRYLPLLLRWYLIFDAWYIHDIYTLILWV